MVATETGPRFFALAFRVSAYQGVMAARHTEWAMDDEPETPRWAGGQRNESTGTKEEMIRAGLGDLIEFGEG